MILELGVFLLSVTAFPGQGTATAGVYCFSDPGGPVVYFSTATDSKMNPAVSNDGYPAGREFYSYLKARYGFITNSNYPVTCTFAASTAVSEANRGVMEGNMRQQQKQVVEADWTYQPDPAAATASFNRSGDPRDRPPPPGPAEHGYCVAGQFTGPQYLSEPFSPPQPANISQWGQAWLRFLGGKYAYKGTIDCSNATEDGARRILKAWGDGARGAGRTVVQTGWKYDAAATTVAAAPVDADPEPARPAAGGSAASSDARAMALKESPATLKYCQADKLLSVVFDCLRVQQAVMAYRMEHPGSSPEPPVAVLFTGDKLDCSHCLDNTTQKAWARREALAQHMKPAVANCVSREFVVRLKAKPYPNRIQEHYDAAVKTCKGQG
jgi:hypothetical protein